MEKHVIYSKSKNSAMDIARYIVHKCIDDGHPISNLQLQKILYFIQKDFLQKESRLAFSDSIEAWKFGPVVPEVYYHYSGSVQAITIELSPNVSLNSEDKSKVDEIVDKLRS